jgi:hypothetical protein
MKNSPEQKARLPNPRVANQQQFEEIVTKMTAVKKTITKGPEMGKRISF